MIFVVVQEAFPSTNSESDEYFLKFLVSFLTSTSRKGREYVNTLWKCRCKCIMSWLKPSKILDRKGISTLSLTTKHNKVDYD